MRKYTQRPTIIIAALILLVAMALAGCGNAGGNGADGRDGAADGQQAPAEQGEAIAADAKTIYQNRCIHCHGRDLEGRTGPNSNLQGVGSRLSVEEIADTIRNGRSSTPMPGFQGVLTDEEIQAMAKWLAEQ